MQQNINGNGETQKTARNTPWRDMQWLGVEPKTAEIMRRNHSLAMVDAAERARILCGEHERICGVITGERKVPAGIREFVERLGRKLGGTQYEGTLDAIKEMALEENPYLRFAGERLLVELVSGRRHLEHCNIADLRNLGWEPDHVTAHLEKDPVYPALWPEAFQAIDMDAIIACSTFHAKIMRIFVGNDLEFAATGAITFPLEWKIGREGNLECAREFAEELRRDGGRGIPIFWNFLYEFTAGEKNLPRNDAYFDAARKQAAVELGRMREGLEAALNPLSWLAENTSCIFTGANDLAALAAYLYRDAVREGDEAVQEDALGVLRELCKEPDLLLKLMRKRGIPKAELGLW
jgi:hypothetical protein